MLIPQSFNTKNSVEIKRLRMDVVAWGAFSTTEAIHFSLMIAGLVALVTTMLHSLSFLSTLVKWCLSSYTIVCDPNQSSHVFPCVQHLLRQTQTATTKWYSWKRVFSSPTMYSLPLETKQDKNDGEQATFVRYLPKDTSMSGWIRLPGRARPVWVLCSAFDERHYQTITFSGLFLTFEQIRSGIETVYKTHFKTNHVFRGFYSHALPNRLEGGYTTSYFEEIRNLVDQFLSAPESPFSKSSLGLLFYGKPGTGKTSLAYVLAKEFGLDVFAWQIGDFDQKNIMARLVGGFSQKLVLIDDVDLLIESKERTHQLLELLDFCQPKKRFVFVLTTNNKDVLPAALLRRGRIEAQIPFECLESKQVMYFTNVWLSNHRNADTPLFRSALQKRLCSFGPIPACVLMGVLQNLHSKYLRSCFRNQPEEEIARSLLEVLDQEQSFDLLADTPKIK